MEKWLSSLSDPNIALSGWIPALVIFILGFFATKFLNKSVKGVSSKADELTKKVESIEVSIKSESEEIREGYFSIKGS